MTTQDEIMVVPPEVALAIGAARPELLKLGAKRAMNEQEVSGLYAVIAELIQQNFDLQREVKHLLQRTASTLQHAKETADLARQLAQATHVLHGILNTTEDDEEDE